MVHAAPEAVITVTTFRDEAMDMRVPLKISAKGVKNHNEAGGEVFRHVHFKEHAGNNAGDGMKETVEKTAIFKKEMAEVFIDRENTMPMGNIN